MNEIVMRNRTIDPATVPGWKNDADPENDPAYPMRNVSRTGRTEMTWMRPPRQEETVEVLTSIERNNLPAVFGTSTPPSGMIRRRAFRYSEPQWHHWLMLMAADRVNVL